jgi:hypothetical protein
MRCDVLVWHFRHRLLLKLKVREYKPAGGHSLGPQSPAFNRFGNIRYRHSGYELFTGFDWNCLLTTRTGFSSVT